MRANRSSHPLPLCLAPKKGQQKGSPHLLVNFMFHIILGSKGRREGDLKHSSPLSVHPSPQKLGNFYSKLGEYPSTE